MENDKITDTNEYFKADAEIDPVVLSFYFNFSFDEFGIAPEIQYTGTLEIDEHSDDFQQAIQNAETEQMRRESKKR